MNDFMMVSFKPDPNINVNSIVINATLCSQAGYVNNQIIQLKIGKTKFSIKVKINTFQMDKNTLYLNPTLIKKAFIEIGRHYGIKLGKDSIRIGPVVGIMAPKISSSKIKPYGPQTVFFEELIDSARRLGEICFVFFFRDIDWNRKIINGYSHSLNGWQRIKYPIPDVIYPRSKFWAANQAANRRKLNKLEVTILNPPVLGKWDAYRYLKKNPELASYLPDTRLVKKFHQVDLMVKKYRSIYLKPVNGTKGKNIIRISRNKKSPGYSYQYHLNGCLHKGSVLNLAHLQRQLRPLMAGRSYLVQKEINLIKYDGGIVDIRVMVQKDNHNSWEVTGMACRVGKEGAITSNISSGGSGEKVETVLNKVFSDRKHINQIIETIIFVSINAAQSLEKHLGNCGEMGIDIGVDRFGQVWFIEANLRPARYVFSLIGEKQTRIKSVETPLLYARYLAGF